METLNSLASSISEEFVLELLDIFVEDAPMRLRELRSALDREDIQTAARAAHTLGTMVVTVGYEELGTQFRQIESSLRTAGVAQTRPLLEGLDGLLEEVLATADQFIRSVKP